VVAVFVVFVAVAILAVAGLVIDGGYTMAAKRAAAGHAEQAARVGADALDEASLRGGGAPQVDPAAAVAAAQEYLYRIGARGSVSVDGATVTVSVTHRQDTAILSAVGVSSLAVTATASARSIDDDDQV
jgi:hypothetical protein